MTAVMMSQVSGADAVSISWASDESLYLGGEYDIIRQLVHTHLNLIAPPDLEVLRSILTISPDMVTLVPLGYGHTGLDNEWFDAPWPQGDSLERPVERMTRALQENRILTNILIRPTATHVRQCAEIKTDYVHIDASRYVQAAETEEKSRIFEEMAGAAKTAARLNMGVSVGRGVDYRTAAELAGIAEVEEMVVGYAVAVRAMTIGFERSVRDLVDIIRHAPRPPIDW
jgi:pyridoxine 5'-phosphate synthase PdxJ